MARITICFSGNVKKFSVRQAGEKQVAEFSICRKNYNSKKDVKDTFTWINVSIYDPKPFVLEHLRDDIPIAGEGEAILRSYEKQDGTKGVSLDVRCQSQGIDFPFSEGHGRADAAAPNPARPSAPADIGGGSGGDEPPFMRRGEWE